jgi:hypothetical protein
VYKKNEKYKKSRKNSKNHIDRYIGKTPPSSKYAKSPTNVVSEGVQPQTPPSILEDHPSILEGENAAAEKTCESIA